MGLQTIPNFFLAGAPKAGTTSLYHYLAQHPDIFMSPVKEPTYFAFEARAPNFVPELQAKVRRQEQAVRERLDGGLDRNQTRGVVTHWKDYLKLYEKAGQQRAVGEASVCYLWSRTAAREIMAMNPRAKFLLVLRDPAERAFSQYLHYLSDGHIAHSFTTHIKTSLQHDGKLSAFHPFLEFGTYAEQLERLFEWVPRAQVKVWLYEDTLRAPEQFVREVFQFLQVDPEFTPDRTRRYHEMEIPKALGVTQALRRGGVWRALRNATPPALRPAVKKLVYRPRGSMQMGAEDRAFLVQHYSDDVARLEAVLDRDLATWKH